MAHKESLQHRLTSPEKKFLQSFSLLCPEKKSLKTYVAEDVIQDKMPELLPISELGCQMQI